MSGAPSLTQNSFTGFLEKAGDVDFFNINFKNPKTLTVRSNNIDVQVSVYNPGGKLFGVYNDPNDIGVAIPNLSGNKYIKIEAAGNEHVPAQFMTGKYYVSY